MIPCKCLIGIHQISWDKRKIISICQCHSITPVAVYISRIRPPSTPPFTGPYSSNAQSLWHYATWNAPLLGGNGIVTGQSDSAPTNAPIPFSHLHPIWFNEPHPDPTRLFFSFHLCWPLIFRFFFIIFAAANLMTYHHYLLASYAPLPSPPPVLKPQRCHCQAQGKLLHFYFLFFPFLQSMFLMYTTEMAITLPFFPIFYILKKKQCIW